MKKVIYPLLLILLVSCNRKETDPITNASDYNQYLTLEAPKTTSKYFEQWNSKIQQDSTQLLSFGKVAGVYTSYFKKTGNIEYLKKAERALTKAVEIANIGRSGYRRALARNYISQHRFKEALAMANEANQIGGGKKSTQSLLFDVHMELGNYKLAEKYLDSIKNWSDFGYLIRAAKWNDYKGDLDTTIRLMEKALQRAESSKNKELLVWSYSNSADYYGHAGELEKSYSYYLKTLAHDPGNAYAKKGIAWIVYSHEKNGKEAMRILNAITQYHKAPDYYLLKAEIADFMGNMAKADENRKLYTKAVTNDAYGVMYNAYTIPLLIDAMELPKASLNLAQQEVTNRPTPEAYGLLASAYLATGELQKAATIVDTQIMGKTYEPAVLMTAAKVFKANNELDKVRPLKKELQQARYELGPLAIETITRL